MPLSDDDVGEILRLIDESNVRELRVETGGLSLYVLRDDVPGTVPPATPAAMTAEDGLVTITSPMLGTFYRAEAPGAAPFVAEGGRVEPETVVCLIEVMKMMNSIPAGVSGELVEVCPDNAELVEYGQPLFRVRPR